jgi:hypothetical protein
MLRIISIMAICSLPVLADPFNVVEKYKNSSLAIWEIVLIIKDNKTIPEISELSPEERNVFENLPLPQKKELFNKIRPIFMSPFPYEQHLLVSDRRDLNEKRRTLENWEI